jgi:hypothetical protein
MQAAMTPEHFLPAMHLVSDGPQRQRQNNTLGLLAGRKTVGSTQGSILFAGNKPTRQFLRKFTGYVEQFGKGVVQPPLSILCLTAACSIAATAGVSTSSDPPACCWLRLIPLLCALRLLLRPFCCTPLVPADTLLPILTVEEMMLYTAELKRPRSEPLAAKKAAVAQLLEKLALTTCR